MLIRSAELDFGVCVADVRVEDGLVREIAPRLSRHSGEEVIEAGGAALLPSLHDHHIHLYALAAAQASVQCGPPDVTTADALVAALQRSDADLEPGAWLRGVGFHESVMAGSGVELDRVWLDRVLPQRPLRVQHRSGRLWVFNGAALRRLGIADGGTADDPLERVDGQLTGRLFDADGWLRSRTGSMRPGLAAISRRLWDWGVTAVTDTSHGNGLDDYHSFAEAQRSGELLQDVLVMGNAELHGAQDIEHGGRQLLCGAHKFHLHAHDLPEFDGLCADIRRAHRVGRNVAFHCITRSELVYALAALREVGASLGDRIEHAAITPPEQLVEIAALKLTVVTQPGFIAERGDDYLHDVEAQDQPWLYRVHGFVDAGVPLALSSDAPYTDANPWAAMQAAVDRRTVGGATIGRQETVTPEQAYALMTGGLRQPGRPHHGIEIGTPADFCLLPEPWIGLRTRLADARPQCVIKSDRTPSTAPIT